MNYVNHLSSQFLISSISQIHRQNTTRNTIYNLPLYTNTIALRYLVTTCAFNEPPCTVKIRYGSSLMLCFRSPILSRTATSPKRPPTSRRSYGKTLPFQLSQYSILNGKLRHRQLHIIVARKADRPRVS